MEQRGQRGQRVKGTGGEGDGWGELSWGHLEGGMETQ